MTATQIKSWQIANDAEWTPDMGVVALVDKVKARSEDAQWLFNIKAMIPHVKKSKVKNLEGRDLEWPYTNKGMLTHGEKIEARNLEWPYSSPAEKVQGPSPNKNLLTHGGERIEARSEVCETPISIYNRFTDKFIAIAPLVLSCCWIELTKCCKYPDPLISPPQLA